MTSIVTGAVIALEAAGFTDVFAWRRWTDPAQGEAALVITSSDDWAAIRTTAEAPTLRVLVYANPTADQDDAEEIAVEVAGRVRSVFHRPQGGSVTWGGHRVLSSQHVGSALLEVEGHPSWRVRILTFEVLTG